jgi:hypothetical protein
VCAAAGADADVAGAEADGACEVVLLQPETANAAPMASAMGVSRCLCMG